MSYGPENEMRNPVNTGGIDTDKMAGIMVIGALVLLVAIHRGFVGVSVSRATGGLVRA